MNSLYYYKSGGVTPTPTWSKQQLMDMQGDLMIWCPEVKRQDAELEIRAGARGIDNGWMWSLWLYRFPADKREIYYQAILKTGQTHVAIGVAKPSVDEGYHNLAPMTQSDVDGYGVRIKTVHDELIAHHLIPVWAGCAPNVPGVIPEQPLAPGLNPDDCLIAMNDWDNTSAAWSHIEYLAKLFPKSLIYFELPGPADNPYPSPSGGTEPIIPGPDNGGAWLREVQRTFPNFIGVLHELGAPNDYAGNIAWLNKCRTWWRDVQQVLFETDTYWKFWENLDPNIQRTYNDNLAKDCPWLKGFFGGGTTHPPIPTPVDDGHYVGYLKANEIQLVDGLDFRNFAETTQLQSVKCGVDNLYVVFDKQDTWPNVSFGIQYSLGLCLNINGVWYGNAPIELWKGLPGSGGQIQLQNVDGSGIGQIPKNWFYDSSRWGIMAGYQPKPGEVIGVFVVAGDARNSINPVQERSNIVLIPLPNSGTESTFIP